MDALQFVPRAATADSLHAFVRRTAKETCTTDKNGHRVCKKESFFHRVGRYILIVFLLILVASLLCCLCCCLSRRKKNKDVIIDQGGVQKQGGFMSKLPFGKKNKTPEYNLETANANGHYAPPPPPTGPRP